MDKSHINGKILFALSLCILGIMILSFSVIISNNSVFAASDFEIEAKINLQKFGILKKIYNPTNMMMSIESNLILFWRFFINF